MWFVYPIWTILNQDAIYPHSDACSFNKTPVVYPLKEKKEEKERDKRPCFRNIRFKLDTGWEYDTK